MNAWNVIWWQAGKKYRRRFEGDKPSESGATAFAKSLQAQDITPHLSSASKAYPPPLKLRIPPDASMLWCPYCLKWRFFVDKAIRHGGWVGPSLWRCPICTISIKDAYVRRYNVTMVIRLEGAKVKVPSEKLVRRKLRRRDG